MANTVKLKDGSYIDSTGVYDTEQGANLATVVSGLKNDKSNLLKVVAYTTTTGATEYTSGSYAWVQQIALDGYTPLIASVSSEYSTLVMGGMEDFRSTYCMGFYNRANLNVKVWVLYVKNS